MLGLALSLFLVALTPLPAPAFDLGHKRPAGVHLGKLDQLVTHEHRRFARSTLRSRPFVVVFGFTHCPDVCPTTLLDITNHLATFGARGERMNVLFVTVDPERDTPAALKQYLASFDPRIVGLTGHPTDIAAAADALNSFYERIDKPDGSYTVDHTLKVHFFDRYGLLAASVDLLKAPQKRIHDLLSRLLAQ
jgi:protein SCO1/2